jgi:hypothetical protein
MTLIDERPLLVIVPEDASEEEWHEGRDGGVTASEIHDIAAARSLGPWDRILEEKLNGSTFKGNDATRAGHEAEPLMIAAVRNIPGVISAGGSHALFGNVDNPLHRATPDGFGVTAERPMSPEFGIEAKWHDAGWAGAVWSEEWDTSAIPADHMDQMQWGMHVTGLQWWLYVVTVEGIEGIKWVWVARDDTRIGQLVKAADAFIAWRAAGAPMIDDLPVEIDDAIAERADQQQRAAAAKRKADELDEQIKAWAAEQGAKPGEPLRKAGTSAAVFFEPRPDVVELDELAWREHEPDTYNEYVSTIARAEAQRAAAAELYSRTRPVAPTYRITPNKREESK